MQTFSDCVCDCRLTALSRLTLQTASHNACLLANLGVLCSHPSLVELSLLHYRDPKVGMPAEAAPVLKESLPPRLTSLRMQDWGCVDIENQQPLHEMLKGAGQVTFLRYNLVLQEPDRLPAYLSA